MNSLVNRLRTGSISLSKGVIAGHLIIVLAAPVLTRLYPPEAFGVYGVLIAISGVVGVALLLRYEAYIPTAGDRELRHRLPGALGAVAAATATAALLILLVLFSLYPPGTASRGFAGTLYAALLCVAAATAYAAFNAMAIAASRFGNFGDVNRSRVQRNAVMVAGQLSFYAASIPGALFLADTVGRFTSLIYLTRRVELRWRFSSRYLRYLLARHASYPLFSMPAAVMNIATANLYAPFIALLYGPARAGEVFLIYRVVAVPITLLGQTLAISYMGAVSDYVREERYAEVRSAIIKTSVHITCIAVPSLVAIYAFLAVAARDVFGGQWGGLAGIFLLLSPAFALQLAFSSFSQSLNVFGFQRFQLAWDGTRLALVIAALGWPVMTGFPRDEGFLVALGCYSAVLAVMYFVQFAYFINRMTALAGRKASLESGDGS